MLFGIIPSSYVYGLVYEKTAIYEGEGENRRNVSRGGMMTIMFSSMIGTLGLLIAMLLKKKSIQMSENRVV